MRFAKLKATNPAAKTAGKELITTVIVVVAMMIFVKNGMTVLTSATQYLAGVGGGSDRTLTIALILNIALILFGFRRYKDLTREIAERATAEEEAQRLAQTDPLTGFHNRRSLVDAGSDSLLLAHRKGQQVAVVMLDLDHFKNVNDMHGHATGDALLKAVAGVIDGILPPGSVLARLGGDEFCCVLTFDPVARDKVDQIVHAIVSRLAQPFEVVGIFAHISVSAGIAHSGAGAAGVEDLIRHADIAMYTAKRSGRNRLAWFDAQMEHDLQARSDVESGMRSGIPNGEFVPYFEQQIDLTTGRLGGFEVLARWEHPTRGLVAPDSFIPVAEETGMIADLSISVMRQALLEAKNWDPSLSISVNISPAQLKDPWLAQRIVKLLVETGFPANRLEVEITETSLFENLAMAQSIVGSLKNQGIRLALDDFGTGYSSLAHLRMLPFDRIKIDKSFVTSINENPESAAIVNAIARLGDSLGLAVTAEGIEDAKIEERLRQIGCQKGQGWHFGRPLGIPGTKDLLAERNLLPAVRKAKEANTAADEAASGLRKTAA
jgi:diguanylate cyclase (GGDEF)-like protein